MPATINPLITDAGLNAAIDASNASLQLAITHVALGDGQYTPSLGQTALSNRREKVTVAGGNVSGTGAFNMSALFPAWAGAAYNAGELGFYAGDPDAGGILFAVHSAPATVLVNRTNIDYTLAVAMQLTRVPAGSITITVDPSASQALAALTAHLGEANPHPQYVRHDVAQALSNTAKQNARRNIGAAPGGGNRVLTAGTTSLGIADAGLIYIDASGGNVNVNLPSASALAAMPLKFVRLDTNYAATVTVSRINADLIDQAGASFGLSPGGDYREILADGTTRWLTISAKRDGLMAGDILWTTGNVARPGTIKANGALLSRTAYPELFAFANAQGLVTENDWSNNGYSGRYSVGDSATTFRVPDLRGMHVRSLDDGRGIDTGRGLGVFQDSQNQAHAHTAAAAAAADHAHTASAAAVGDHVHSAWTDSQGYHAHGVNDPGHRHTWGPSEFGNDAATGGGYTSNDGANSLGHLSYTSSSGTGISINSDGLHGHNVGIGGAGGHDHNITVNGAGGHGHAITVDSAGGAEARVKNLAYLACIKF